MPSTASSQALAPHDGDRTGAAGPSAALTLSRPARKQISHRELENIRQTHDRANQAGISYNIWYNKYSGGDNDDGRTTNTKASTRVHIARDQGLTRANEQGNLVVCLFFARGYCPNGADCQFLHSLPVSEHTSDQGHDVFGREKFGTARDDMGGVGTIQRVNKTLYVGRIVEEAGDNGRRTNRTGASDDKKASSASKQPKWNAFQPSNGSNSRGWNRWTMGKDELTPTEKVLFRHFGEFGAIERIRVLHSRGCGFITFDREVDAQFAKEAMMHQSLDHDECINLRWATDDPNPAAQKRDRLAREKEGLEAIQANMSEKAVAAARSIAELEQEREEEGQEKRRRIEGAAPEEMSEEEYQRLAAENERNWEEMKRQEAEDEESANGQANSAATLTTTARDEQNAPEVATPKENGLFDADSLRALRNLRQTQQVQAATTKTEPPTGLLGVAAYGSDSEGEEDEE